MKLHFEADLPYQANAIEAVCDLFRGQEVCRSEFTVTLRAAGTAEDTDTGPLQGALEGMAETPQGGVGNRLTLLDDEVDDNLKAIQLRNGLPPSTKLSGDFTVEMETGTGKTYVYLRTVFELNKRYGFTKFVIVVPSVAIKEGVNKTLEITRDHLEGLYPGAKGYEFFQYDSAKLGQVRNFATSPNVQIMVITVGAINKFGDEDAAEAEESDESRRREKSKNVMYRASEKTGGEKPIDLVRQTRPILIVDEPQSVDGGIDGRGKRALDRMNPLCSLRYSATHADKHNMVYPLRQTKADDDTYNLIMRDKEKLLGFASPLKFIFSHSALKEGWDNPNVFQICNFSARETDRWRRQTIGRGLRLCVNQYGVRLKDSVINTLTVITTESYQEFAENLQKDIERETGIQFGVVPGHMFAAMPVTQADGTQALLGFDASQALADFLAAQGYIDAKGKVQEALKKALKDNKLLLPPAFEPQRAQIAEMLRKASTKLQVKNADDRRPVPVRRAVLDSAEFNALWDRIKHKTTYRVQFDNEKLILDCIAALTDVPPITKTRLQWRKAGMAIGKGGVEATELTGADTVNLNESDIELPDVLTELQDRTQLTRRSIGRILTECRRLDDFKRNPQEFIKIAAEAINRCKRHVLVDGIKYQRRWAATTPTGPCWLPRRTATSFTSWWRPRAAFWWTICAASRRTSKVCRRPFQGAGGGREPGRVWQVQGRGGVVGGGCNLAPSRARRRRGGGGYRSLGIASPMSA